MPRMGIRAKTFQALRAQANPQIADQPEAAAHILYDTQTYTDNTTAELTFFTATQTNRDLSNLQAGGSLPDPQYFELHYIYVDAFPDAEAYVSTAAGGVTGYLNDIGQLLVAGRGRLTFSLADKQYGPWPLQAFRGSGAVNGFINGTFTAEEVLQYGHNAVTPDGGLCFEGSIIIPPRQGFSITLAWPSALDLTGDYRIRIGMAGVLYRKVA